MKSLAIGIIAGATLTSALYCASGQANAGTAFSLGMAFVASIYLFVDHLRAT